MNINKMKYKIKAKSPEILMAAGVIGVVTSTVLACKSTMKLSGVVENAKNTLNNINELQQQVNDGKRDDYDNKTAKKDKTIVYVSTGLEIAKLYIPSAILGCLSIACMIQSNNILKKRNVALLAAFESTNKAFKKYRSAVVERFGERVDYELKNGIKAEKITITEEDENGKKTKKKETIDVMNSNNLSQYAKYFDESNPNFSPDDDYNLMFLRSQQQYANDKLVAQGYLFLNDVYDALGIPRTSEGQVVGWLYKPEGNENGDNYVDFGLYDINVQGYADDYTNDTISEERIDFVNGYKKTVLLDFNVDGVIFDKI